MPIKFGLQQSTFSGGDPRGMYPAIERIAVEAERAGFDSLWLMDHMMQTGHTGGDAAPILEAWVTLGALAARTSRVRLGVMVASVPYRNPALLAKTGASLDVISGGRFIMGLGAGWVEREFNAYGWPFPPVGERMKMLEEATQIVLRMWTEEHPSFRGAHYAIQDARCEPRPLQKPHPPIVIGGAGEKVTLRLVAKYAQMCNIFGDPATVRQKLDVLERHCETERRDPATIVKTRLGRMLVARNEAELKRKLERYAPQGVGDGWSVIAGTPAQCVERCGKLLEAGADYLIFGFPDADTLEPLRLFMEEVAPKVERR
ncbi:MAG: LLM class F420-dependent oxidoreductase [Dehalococcoidia bacterium]|nr:LLM class F420-dependent oxidoreductase [Dehalococcoidia bacterium]